MKYLTVIREESWKSLPVVEKFGRLALVSMLIPLVDSFTWSEVNLCAFAFVIFVSDWFILAFEDPLKDPLKGQNVLQL